jgi:hypothetical protein
MMRKKEKLASGEHLGWIDPPGCALRLDPRHSLGHEILARHLEIVVRLEIQPEFRAGTEIQAETERHVSSVRRRLFTISAIRFGEMPIAFASWFCDRPHSAKNSGVDPPMKARSQDSVILSFFLSGLFWTPASVKRSP